jgi:hypothetical protein
MSEDEVPQGLEPVEELDLSSLAKHARPLHCYFLHGDLLGLPVANCND